MAFLRLVRMTAEVEVAPTPPARLARLLARHLVRTARQRVRARRSVSPPLSPLDAGRARLVPLEASWAEPWFELTSRAGRPPAVGLAASPLGGMARTPGQWQATARQLGRDGTPAYLVVVDGAVAGEVLGYHDGATAVVELAVWLAPEAHPAADDVLAALVRALLGGGVRRLQVAASAGSAVAEAALRQGFLDEGIHTDPPYTARHIFVRHHR